MRTSAKRIQNLIYRKKLVMMTHRLQLVENRISEYQK